MSVFSNGWALMRQSWHVLRADKELVVFPILSAAAGLVVLASFALPFAMTIPWESIGRKGEEQPELHLGLTHYALLFSFYVVNFMAINFFNAALAACVLERFRGGDPTVRFGLRAAVDRLPQIVGWALLAATVGMIIKAIQERVGLIGKIVTAIIGVAWTIASYFVVPVLIAEKIGPIDALKRSGQLITQTWGASLVSNVGLGLAGFLAVLAALLPLGGGVALLIFGLSSRPDPQPAMVTIGIALIVVAAFALMAVSLITATLKSILNTALYHYAVHGAAPEGFDNNLFQQAFRTKKK